MQKRDAARPVCCCLRGDVLIRLATANRDDREIQAIAGRDYRPRPHSQRSLINSSLINSFLINSLLINLSLIDLDLTRVRGDRW